VNTHKEEIIMPSLINTAGSIHNLAANYRKMTPTQSVNSGEFYSNFGTRQLAWFKVELADLNNADNFTNADSVFAKAVRGLQLNTEVYFISKPVSTTTDYFVVAVTADTTPDNSNDGADTVSPTQAELVKRIVDRATEATSTVTAYVF
jgi:hypothetical protein